jgi:hypothetical protein
VPVRRRYALLPANDRCQERRNLDPIGFSADCGFSVAEFDVLYSDVRPLLEAGMRVRSSIADPTAAREGRPWRRKISPACGLFLTLKWLRDYMPVRSLASDFALCDSSTSEVILHTLYCLHEGLQDEISWPSLPQVQQLAGIGMPAGLADCWALIDATCVWIRRPEEDQGSWYRGDKRRHFVNTQVLASLAVLVGCPCWLTLWLSLVCSW